MVGLVSARLLAAGTPRRQRLHALSLFGLLSDHADAARRVRLPLDDLAGEFQLPPGQVERALEDLLRVGAVRRSAEGLVLARHQPAPRDALRLSAFLANVAAVLDEERTQPVPRPQTGSPVLLADRAGTPAPTGERLPRRARPRQPALAALALTAVVLLAALASSSGVPTRLRTVGDPGRAPTEMATEPPTAVPGIPESSVPGPGAVEESPPDTEARTVPDDPSSPRGPSGPAAPSREPVTGTEGRSGNRSTRTPVTDRTGTSTVRRATAPPRAAEQSQPASPAAPSGSPGSPPAEPASPAPAARCPARVPRIVVESAVVRPAGPDLVAGVPTTSITEVRGSLINPTSAAAVIRAFEVVVRTGEDTVTIPGPAEPVDLRPGGHHEWTVRTASDHAQPGTAATVEEARILDWHWQDAEVARACRP